MARIRTIKPSFWPSVAHMSRDARLFALALMSFADDDGRFVATPSAVLGYAYPMDGRLTRKDFERWMVEVCTPKPGEAVPTVIRYCRNGFDYAYLPKFRLHQKINRPQPSALPAPPEDALFEV